MEDGFMNDMNGTGQTSARERSTGELVKLVAEQVSVLVRDELKLAQLELAGKGKRARTGIGLMGGGGLIALYGVACLTACVIIAISHAITAWLAALIVGAALLAAAAVVALAGRARLRQASPPIPEEAVDGIKADVQEVREGVRR
jgi:uncharacterized membrane protein YqjE